MNYVCFMSSVCCAQRGVMPIYTSRDPSRITIARLVFTFFIKERYMKRIDALHVNMRYDWDPSFVEDT